MQEGSHLFIQHQCQPVETCSHLHVQGKKSSVKRAKLLRSPTSKQKPQSKAKPQSKQTPQQRKAPGKKNGSRGRKKGTGVTTNAEVCGIAGAA